MAFIDRQTVSQIEKSEQLINFITENIYLPENSNILRREVFETLPDYAQCVILILEFDTEYHMQGIFTILENSIGHYLWDIAVSFEKTNNTKISTQIKEILNTLKEFNLTPDKIRNGWIYNYQEHDIIQDSSINNEKLRDKICQIDEELSVLILEEGCWDNVIKFVEDKLMK